MQQQKQSVEIAWIDSADSNESSCDDDFDMVQSYNDRIKAMHDNKLKEQVLEALAFNASANQIKRELNEEAMLFRKESLMLRAFVNLHTHATIFAKLDFYRQKVAFNYLYHAVILSKRMRKFEYLQN